MNNNYNNGIPNGYNYAPNNNAVPNNGTSINDEISRGMSVYFKAKEKNRYLTEDNKMLVSNAEYYISTIPNEHPVKQIINNEINNYYAKARETGQAENRNNADELRQSDRSRALVKQEDTPLSRRSAFINIAILIYGSLNIGFIIAIALLK